MKLVDKYNGAVPRYTSYPTVPYWDKAPGQEEWKKLVRAGFAGTNASDGISIYVHLPFCESLCTYCACNTRITVNHKVEGPYIDAVLKEWALYRGLMNEKPRVREIHLGGGTPTFFAPEQLGRLISGLLADTEIVEDHAFSFEGHPANTTPAHLQVLYDHGFRRVSFGIQDFDPVVQDVINRYQDLEQVQLVVEAARRIGYTSVNFDLVYGLPFQRLDTITDTISKVIGLRPDRIAFYSYAHVPWLKPGQRKFTEKDLPVSTEKRALYEKGLEMFSAAGYLEVGLDHFALPGDELFAAASASRLHRNFMGYTDKHTELMISLGASAISDTWNAFSQNIKAVEPYQAAVNAGNFPISKGHLLTADDERLRKHILNLMCKGDTRFDAEDQQNDLIQEGLERCIPLREDGLLMADPGGIRVTAIGRPFLRNICLCFDSRFWKAQPVQQIFSTVA